MDTDIDVNADGNADIDMSSVLSFKGLIHFCMGFGWFIYASPPYIVLHYLGAVISGSFFCFRPSFGFINSAIEKLETRK